MGLLSASFFIFVFSVQLTENKYLIIQPGLYFNLGPVVSEATTLPNVPQPLTGFKKLIECTIR